MIHACLPAKNKKKTDFIRDHHPPFALLLLDTSEQHAANLHLKQGCK